MAGLRPESGLRIAMVAGELSGDTLGGGLISSLRAQRPGTSVVGVGGAQMRAAGMETWHDAEVLAVMGLTEVLRHLRRLLRLRAELIERIVAAKPDVFVGIDAPDFNLGLERRLRERGIPTVHYVSPSVWAWRQGRVKTIARACDRVLCLLPFEPEFYARHGVAAQFVGHPLARELAPPEDPAAVRAALGIAPEARVLAVMPGSRRGEIARLGGDFLAAAALLRERVPGLEVLVPLASAAGAEALASVASERGLGDTFRVSVGNARECMAAADVLLLASGTVALEGLLLGKPMVVAYRVAAATYRIVRTLNLIKLKHVSLPNLLTREPWVPELLQTAVTPDALAEALQRWFERPDDLANMQAAFAEVRDALAVDANVRAAQAVIETAGQGSA